MFQNLVLVHCMYHIMFATFPKSLPQPLKRIWLTLNILDKDSGLFFNLVQNLIMRLDVVISHLLELSQLSRNKTQNATFHYDIFETVEEESNKAMNYTAPTK